MSQFYSGGDPKQIAELRLRAKAEMDLIGAGIKIEDKSQLWKAFPGPQTAARDSEADELLYGGAAGGGKTGLGVGLSMTEHLRSIMFRREFPQAREIEDQLDEFAPSAKVNRVTHRWIIQAQQGIKRIIEIGAVKLALDWQKYKGRPHDLIFFDELTEFLQIQYRSLIIWNRSVVKGQRVRVICGTNPPLDQDGRWILAEWGPWLLDDEELARRQWPKAKAGELVYYHYGDEGQIFWYLPDEVQKGPDGYYVLLDIVDSDNPDGKQDVKSRTFIPAKIEDNPMFLGSGYKGRLGTLPPELRAAFLHGDFKAGISEDPLQAIPTAWISAAMARWEPNDKPGKLSALGVDPARGGKDNTVISARYGTWYAPLDVHEGAQTPDGQTVAALVLNAHSRANSPESLVIVDVIGIGASCYDFLCEHKLFLEPFNSSFASDETDHSGLLSFFNLRAEAVWKLREALDPNSGMDLALPPDSRLKTELAAHKFKVTARGIQINDKKDIKTLIGRSPDRADAVFMSSTNAEAHYVYRSLA